MCLSLESRSIMYMIINITMYIIIYTIYTYNYIISSIKFSMQIHIVKYKEALNHQASSTTL